MLYFLLLITSLTAFVFYVFYKRECKSHVKTLDDFEVQMDKAYKALQAQMQINAEKDTEIAAINQGRDEETECYEAMYLDWEDKQVALQAIIGLHNVFCLPHLNHLDRVQTVEDQFADTPIFDDTYFDIYHGSDG